MYHIALRCELFGQLDLVVVQQLLVRHDDERDCDA